MKFFDGEQLTMIASATTEGSATAKLVDGAIEVSGEGKVNVMTDTGVEGFVLVFKQ